MIQMLQLEQMYTHTQRKFRNTLKPKPVADQEGRGQEEKDYYTHSRVDFMFADNHSISRSTAVKHSVYQSCCNHSTCGENQLTKKVNLLAPRATPSESFAIIRW